MLRLLLLGDAPWLNDLLSIIRADNACAPFLEASVSLTRENYVDFHRRRTVDDVDVVLLFSASDLSTDAEHFVDERKAFFDAMRLLLDADIPVFLCGRLSTCLQMMPAFSRDVQRHSR